MFKKLPVTMTALALLAVALPSKAQVTTTNAPSVTSFVQSVESYFTTQNTNSTTFTASRGALWTAPIYQSGVNVADDLGIEYQPLTNMNLVLGSVSTLAGVSGVIDAQQIDVGWKIIHYDVQITLGVGGGYQFAQTGENASLYGAIYAEVRKAMTANTFAGLRLEEDFAFKGGSKPAVPIVGLEVGFTF